MKFEQYYLECLSHASYMIGDETSGLAAVVDPRRDVAEYIADAEAAGLRIAYVIETHFHADFLSGHLELAERTGAGIVYGAAAAGRVEFPIQAMADRERIRLGRVELQVRATPGHGVFSGDTLFIGDVGRPDLLASAGVSADELGRQLYRSLHNQLLTLPDATKVFPAHGAGSACGKSLSTETVSTIGEQRRTNYALAPMSEDDFVAAVTEGQSVAPLYFSFAANRNRQAHDVLDEHAPVRQLTLDEVLAHQAAGGAVVDGRDAAEFAAGHLRGSINVGLAGRYAEYVGEVIPPGTPIAVVAEPGSEAEAVLRLARIGFDDVVGALAEPQRAFVQRPELVARASRITAAELDTVRLATPSLQLVDVRNPGEVADGMLDGARHIPLAALLHRLDELDPAAPTVVYCAGGYRSSIAASTLRALGFQDVSDLVGGYGACALTSGSAR